MNRGIGQPSALAGNENLGSDRVDARSRGKIVVYRLLCSVMKRHKSGLSELRRPNEEPVCGDVSDLKVAPRIFVSLLSRATQTASST